MPAIAQGVSETVEAEQAVLRRLAAERTLVR
jgi:hypothetical protein